MILSDVLFFVGIALVVIGGAAVSTGVVLIIAAVIVVLGSVLTVKVDDSHVSAAFLAGWPKHRIALANIESSERVRNKAWWGIGLRKIPGGWMYNVGGLDAIELIQKNGKKFRIGTNDPDGLEAALTEKALGPT